MAHHGESSALCPACNELLDYSHMRIERCPLLESKPTCTKCWIHCYDLVRREQVKKIMRYSGPRMIFRHPVLAVLHLIDEYQSWNHTRRERSQSFI